MDESSLEEGWDMDPVYVFLGVCATIVTMVALVLSRNAQGRAQVAYFLVRSPSILMLVITGTLTYSSWPASPKQNLEERVKVSTFSTLPLHTIDMELATGKVFEDARINVARLAKGFAEASHGVRLDQANDDTPTTEALVQLDIKNLDLPGARDEIPILETRCYWFKTSHCSPQGLVQGVQRDCNEPLEPRQSGFCSCYGSRFYGKTCMDTNTNIVCEAYCRKFFPNSTITSGPHAKEAAFMHKYFNKTWGGGKLLGHRPSHAELMQRFQPTYDSSVWGQGHAVSPGTQPSKKHAWRGDEVKTKQGLVRLAGFKRSKTNRREGNKEGAVVVLSNTRSLPVLLQTLRTYESTVNIRAHHPYVIFFPPRQRFTKLFKSAVTNVVSGDVFFESIEQWMWDPPAIRRLTRLKAAALETPSRLSNHPTEALLAARFFSTAFYHHPVMERFDYYLRLTQEVAFLCNVYFDPFTLMAMSHKNYAFSLVYTNLQEKELLDKKTDLKLEGKETSAPASSDHDGHLQSIYAVIARYLVARAWRDARVLKESNGLYGWVEPETHSKDTSKGITGFGRKVSRFFQERGALGAKFFNELFSLMDEFTRVMTDELEAVASSDDDQQEINFDTILRGEVTLAPGSDETNAPPKKMVFKKRGPNDPKPTGPRPTIPTAEDSAYFFASAFFDLVASDEVHAEGWIDSDSIFNPIFRELLGVPTHNATDMKQRGIVFEEALRNCEFYTNVEMGSMKFLKDSTGYHDFMSFIDESGAFLSEDFSDSTYRTAGVVLFAGLRSIYHFEPLSFSHNGFFQVPSDSSVCSAFPIPDQSYSSTGLQVAACQELLSGLADP